MLNNIFQQIAFIFTPERDGLFDLVARGSNQWKQRLFKGVLWLTLLIGIAWGFNYFGLRYWNIGLILVFTFVAAYALTPTKFIETMVVAGLLTGDKKQKEKQVEKFLKAYYGIVLPILFFIDFAIYLLTILPTIHFPMVVPLTVVSFLMLALWSSYYKAPVRITKKISFYFIAGTMITTAFLMINPVILTGTLGITFFERFVVTTDEQLANRMKQAEKRFQTSEAIKNLTNSMDEDDLIEQIEKHGVKSLTPTQKKAYDKARKKSGNKNIPKAVITGVGNFVNGINKQRRDRITAAANPYGDLTPYEIARVKFEEKNGKLEKKVLGEGNEIKVLDDHQQNATIYVFSEHNFTMTDKSGIPTTVKGLTRCANVVTINGFTEYVKFKKLEKNTTIYYMVKTS